MNTMYLRSTPSTKRRKKVTKAEQQRLVAHNEERRKMGLPPATSLRAQTLDRSSMVTANKLPDYGRRVRSDPTLSIPSFTTKVSPDATSRNTMMEQVMSGKERPEVAAEIIRKSKCLAPAYNKGAVQYIGSLDAAKDAGRKK